MGVDVGGAIVIVGVNVASADARVGVACNCMKGTQELTVRPRAPSILTAQARRPPKMRGSSM